MAKAGCIYCDKGENINGQSNPHFNIVFGDKLSVEENEGIRTTFYADILIKYCPMCGRKLNGR